MTREIARRLTRAVFAPNADDVDGVGWDLGAANAHRVGEQHLADALRAFAGNRYG